MINFKRVSNHSKVADLNLNTSPYIEIAVSGYAPKMKTTAPTISCTGLLVSK
jgi:hypothetical protein